MFFFLPVIITIHLSVVNNWFNYFDLSYLLKLYSSIEMMLIGIKKLDKENENNVIQHILLSFFSFLFFSQYMNIVYKNIRETKEVTLLLMTEERQIMDDRHILLYGKLEINESYTLCVLFLMIV